MKSNLNQFSLRLLDQGASVVPFGCTLFHGLSETQLVPGPGFLLLGSVVQLKDGTGRPWAGWPAVGSAVVIWGVQAGAFTLIQAGLWMEMGKIRRSQLVPLCWMLKGLCWGDAWTEFSFT